MIRLAEAKDILALVDLAEQMHAESRYCALTFSRKKMQELFETCLHNPDYLLIVAYEFQNLIGGLCAYAMPHFCSDDLVASDIGVFVQPQHRGVLLGSQLISYYKQWATHKQAKLIDLGISTAINIDKTSRVYESLGFQKTGYLFSRQAHV